MNCSSLIPPDSDALRAPSVASVRPYRSDLLTSARDRSAFRVHRLCRLAIIVVLHAAPLSAQSVPETQSVRRLSPSEFPALPGAVRTDLEHRGCRIPQPWGATGRENVISGAFTAAHVREWAVLCSVRDTSQVFIYRVDAGSTARVIDSLLPAADRSWMQGVGDRWGFSRVLRTMPLRYTRHWRHDADGQAIPQPVDHDAIEQVFTGKAAEAFYYVAGHLYRHVTAD